MNFTIKNKEWDFKAHEAKEFNYQDLSENTEETSDLKELIQNPEVSTIFREYDLRGHKDIFDDKIVEAICNAMVIMIKKLPNNNQKVIVGSDNEDYNIVSKNLAKEIFLKAGFEVFDIGMTSSPAIYFAQQYFDCDSIAAFTASHNPYGDKGMKAGVIKYQTFGPAGIDALKEQFYKAEKVSTEVPKEEQRLIEVNQEEVFNAYATLLMNKGIFIPQGTQIMINTLNATAGPVVKHVLERMGLKVIAANYEPIGSKPGDPQKNPELEPVKEETQRLLNEEAKRLAAEDVDTKNLIAVAFDRDGDRMVPVGQKAVCSADELGILAFRQKARNLKKSGQDTPMHVVCDMKSSMAFFEDKVLWSEGVKIVPWYTGHSYIKQYMRYLMSEGKNVIGGAEKSGHQFQEGCYDEPIEDALLLLQYLTDNKISLENALETIEPYELGPSSKSYLDKSKFKPRDERHTLKDRKYEIMQEIIGILSNFEGKEIANGKYLLEKVEFLGLNTRSFFSKDGETIGNFVLRPSSNEEVFTINIETTKALDKDSKQEIIDIQNFIALDVLAANFDEMTTILSSEDKQGWLNNLKLQDGNEDFISYIKESSDWDENELKHLPSGRVVSF